MGVGDALGKLDGRLLPPLGRAFGRLADRPVRLRLITGAGLAAACAVLLTVVWVTERAPIGGPVPPGDVVRVGVVEGQSVPGYVGASRAELAALVNASAPAPSDVYALVSLVTYLAPDRLGPVLGGVAVSQVYARAQLPGMQTQVVRIPAYRVPQDVIQGLREAARGRDQEIADYGQLRRTLTGDTLAEQRLRSAYDRAAAVAAAEAVAYRAGCSCVYAAVVRAAPAALDQLAHRSEVRAVDPAPEADRLDRTEFRPPLPEQPEGLDPALSRTESTPAASAGVPAPSVTGSQPAAVSAASGAPVISASAPGSVTPSSSAGRATTASTAVPSSEPPGPTAGTSP